ncbi:hypothetical protein TNCV_727941 [Trichonephila clavipes]|nr:hypothetical protein TNCV_727941 [Trichonephila clavipes]
MRGCLQFIALSGWQGCILTRTVESNQSGRFDSNEFVADSFRNKIAQGLRTTTYLDKEVVLPPLSPDLSPNENN